MIPMVQLIADEAKERYRLVLEHHRNFPQDHADLFRRSVFEENLFDEYNGNI